ncbi:hypothetical protein NZK32_10000 [Cyanobium sp. FGCU-52]|nr:hypothetical protein [Cyanobium sp. FGCU52]
MARTRATFGALMAALLLAPAPPLAAAAATPPAAAAPAPARLPGDAVAQQSEIPRLIRANVIPGVVVRTLYGAGAVSSKVRSPWTFRVGEADAGGTGHIGSRARSQGSKASAGIGLARP